MKENQLPQRELATGKVAHAIYCEECKMFSGCEVDGVERWCPASRGCHDYVCPDKQGYRMVLKLGICPACCCIYESFLSKEDGLHIPMVNKEAHLVLL